MQTFEGWLPCSCEYVDVGIRCRIPARWSSSGPPSEGVVPSLSLVSPMVLASLSHRQCSRTVARRFGLGCLSDAICESKWRIFQYNLRIDWYVKGEDRAYNTRKVFHLRSERWMWPMWRYWKIFQMKIEIFKSCVIRDLLIGKLEENRDYKFSEIFFHVLSTISKMCSSKNHRHMTYSKVRLLIMIFIETDHKNHITSLNVFYRIVIFRLKKKNIKHFKRIKRNI